MKKIIALVILLLLYFFGLASEKIAELHRVNRPNDVAVDGDRVYVSDSPRVYIYTLRGGKLEYLKSFGREGMGPGEFNPNPRHFNVQPRQDSLFVYSVNKVAFFTKEGKLIRELNSLAVARRIISVKDRMVGRRMVFEGKTRYQHVVLYDADLKPLKTLDKQVYPLQPDNSKIEVYGVTYNVTVGKDKIYTATQRQFVVNIFDLQGRRLKSINIPARDALEKIEDRHKEALHRHLVISSPAYPTYKHRIVFPDYFPALRREGLRVDDARGPGKAARLYAVTWRKQGKDTLVYVFDKEGEPLGKRLFPLVEESAVRMFPFCIHGNNLYQLVENPDTETYELHVAEIKEIKNEKLKMKN